VLRRDRAGLLPLALRKEAEVLEGAAAVRTYRFPERVSTAARRFSAKERRADREERRVKGLMRGLRSSRRVRLGCSSTSVRSFFALAHPLLVSLTLPYPFLPFSVSSQV
jgi:hypothetical protein